MRKRRTRLAAFAAILIAAALSLIFWVQYKAPPEPARLLPEADGYFYVDLRPIRAAGLFRNLPEVALDPEYLDFVQRTGFRFESDLDQAAVAVHLPAPGSHDPTRYSEVFAGRFDPAKLGPYLKQTATSSELYRGSDLLSVPLPGRTLRVSMLGPGRIAASNASTPDAVRSIIDKAKAFTLGLRGPSLLRDYYPNIPLGSVLWMIVRIPSNTGDGSSPGFSAPGGFFVGLSGASTVIVSLRYTGSIDLRAEAFAPNESVAARLSDSLTAYLTLVRAIQFGGSSPVGNNPDGKNNDIRHLLESLKVERHKDRVVLHASASPNLLKSIFAEPPAAPGSQLPATPSSAPQKRP
jgi:hypothetical protein